MVRLLAQLDCTGSPPQVRGKLQAFTAKPKVTGITPAGAGKTDHWFYPYKATRDHPRRCGENRMSRECRLSALGSPPQVRGKRRHCLPYLVKYRITPAGAGKTRRVYANNTHKRDHPRRCGENLEKCAKNSGGIGSPPQVRGKLCPPVSCLRITRITPAGAGKTRG